MDDLRQQHGDHTWDILIHYYCCPNCEYIFEERGKFVQRSQLLQKDLTCPRCQQAFTVTKKTRPTRKSMLEWI